MFVYKVKFKLVWRFKGSGKIISTPGMNGLREKLTKKLSKESLMYYSRAQAQFWAQVRAEERVQKREEK